MKTYIFKVVVLFWKLFPFKKGARKLVQFFPIIKAKLYKDLRFKGVMDVTYGSSSFKLYNPGFTTIENEIFWNGLENGWEKVSLSIWTKLARHSKTILDIGANSGVYSFLASAVNPSAKVIAFEPVQRTADLFRENLRLNVATNIVLHENAVSDKSMITTFYDVESLSQYSASLNAQMLEGVSNRISYDVEAISLDSFLKDLTTLDLIKLDVEMHEPEAVAGMIGLIRKFQPSFLIEVLTDEIALQLDALFAEFSYFYFSIDEKSKPQRISHIQKSEYYNILIIPEDKLSLLDLS